VFEQKLVPVLLCPPYILQSLTCNQILGLHSDRPATDVLSLATDLIVEYFLGVTKETFINNKMGNLRVT